MMRLNGASRRLVLRSALKLRKATEAITLELGGIAPHPRACVLSHNRRIPVTVPFHPPAILGIPMRLLHLIPVLIVAAGTLTAQPVATVTLNGQHFVNHGLVGVGRMPSNLKDKFGETFGSSLPSRSSPARGSATPTVPTRARSSPSPTEATMPSAPPTMFPVSTRSPSPSRPLLLAPRRRIKLP